MSATELMMLAISASMFLVVFKLGLDTTFAGVTYLFRRPALLLRSILAMNIVMPVLAIGACLAFRPSQTIAVALIGLAISPVPPFLPTQQLGAGGPSRYVFGLLVATALASIVLVPAWIALIDVGFARDVRIPASKVATIMLITVLAPLVLGVATRRFAPVFADRIARPIGMVGNVLLAAAAIPLLVIVTPLFWPLVGSGVIAALIAFTLVGVAVGHALGGPDADRRAVLALATGSRHPGIALAIATINFPARNDVIAVVIYHLVIGALVALPYVIWRKRARALPPLPRSGRGPG
jgi:BASS family bile acid:Na+ symporter